MEYFWAVFASAVFVLIVWAIVMSKVKARGIRAATEKVFPRVADHIQVDRRYDIFLSHGKTLRNARFIGISRAPDPNNPSLPFPLCEWLVVEKDDGKRAYVKPMTVRYYEDADERR